MKLFARSSVALLAVLGLSFPLTVQAQIAPDRIPLQTKLDELAHLREAYVDALNTRDVARLTGMYDEDAILVGPDGAIYTGRKAVSTHLAAAMSSQPQSSFRSDSLAVFGNIAIDVGTLTLRPANAKTTTQRYVTVAERGMQGVWKLKRVVLVPIG